MKQPKITLWLLMAVLAFTSPVFADEKSEKEGLRIAKERKARDRGWENTVAEMTMILRNAQGQEAERKMRVKTLEVQDDGDKALTVFDSPRDVSGTAFLSFSHAQEPDEQWIYLPALKRVKRIASRNKSGPFMGSEFAFEDMTSFEVGKFTYDYLREDVYQGDKVYVIEQTPQDEFSGYSKQIVWIDQSEYRVRKVEFFDRKGDALKTLEFKDYKLYEDKFWRPLRSFMYNQQTQKSTELVTHTLSFGEDLEESDFDNNSLRRAR
ncbi:outer membrane lipoprotein-sorting protein [Alteromonas pelagimontana]|uniref:Outer membrane lipoprotein-sorting protein n=1 Tax=Alteromonas pelagimontana TaxID=1858656 RepID=A0A6M4MGF6_9ALTE|nr:outer membrane lipoprotein-sorting protein [Alteromonas pelagimontana]QJR81948.1 outer membrane lipoprotein-sorting protein [Alteromonas pelagimontana]